MPFRSRSQLGVCYNKAIKAGAQGKSSGWDCDKWLAETPNPSCLPYSEKQTKASARPKGEPSPVGRCRTLAAKERVTGPVIEGARGGHYFMAAGVKVYIPKGHAELAYAKRTYGVAGASKAKATRAKATRATKATKVPKAKATKAPKAKATTKAKATKVPKAKATKAQSQTFTDFFETLAGPEVTSQFMPGNGASRVGRRPVAKKKVWKIRFTPILFTDEMSQTSTGSASLDKLVASRLARDQTRIKDIPWDLNPIAVSYEPSKEGLGYVVVTVRPKKAMSSGEVLVAVTEAIEIGPDTWMEGDITILSQAEAAKSPFFKSSKSPVEVTVAIDNVE